MAARNLGYTERINVCPHSPKGVMEPDLLGQIQGHVSLGRRVVRSWNLNLRFVISHARSRNDSNDVTGKTTLSTVQGHHCLTRAMVVSLEAYVDKTSTVECKLHLLVIVMAFLVTISRSTTLTKSRQLRQL